MKMPIKVLGVVVACIWFYGGVCNAVGSKPVAPGIQNLEQMMKDLEALRVQRNKEVEDLFLKMKNVLELLSRPSAQESLSVVAFDAAKKDLAVAARDVLDYFSGTIPSKKLADAESRVEKVRWTVVSTPGAAR
jgi:hypothetical protein